MDDFDLSALSGISSEQSSGFLGEDSGLFQRNDNKNNDSDHEQDNANTYAKNKLKEETKTAEDNTNVLKPTELIKEQDKSKEKIDPVTQHNNDSPSSLLEVEKREVPIVPETKDSIAENQIKITICPSENKRKPSLK